VTAVFLKDEVMASTNVVTVLVSLIIGNVMAGTTVQTVEMKPTVVVVQSLYGQLL